MKADELWKLLCEKNPAFSGGGDEHITQTKRGLRRLFDLAWHQGHEQGVRNGRALEKNEQEKKAVRAFGEFFTKNPFNP